MNFLNWLSGTTPGVAAGQAGAEVVKGLGQTVQSLIEEWHLPPEKAQDYALKILDASLADIQAARQMQSTTHSWVPGLLTLLNTLGFFSVMIYGTLHGLPSNTEFMMMVGSLVSGYGMALQFWLGSSRSSQTKDWLLWQSTPQNGKGK